MTILHILDQNETLVETLENKPGFDAVYWDDLHHRALKDNIDTYEFTTVDTPANRAVPYLTGKNKLVVTDHRGNQFLFTIENVERIGENGSRTLRVEADADHYRLRTAGVIEPATLSGATLNTAADYVLNGTEWQRGITEYSGSRTVTFDEYVNPLKALHILRSTFEVELRFRVLFDGNRIVGKYVDFFQPTEIFDGKEIVFGKDMIGIRRIESTDEVYTTMYGVGPADEDGNYLTFESINNGRKFIEDAEAVQRWGRHWYVYSPETEDTDMTPERLKSLTETALKKHIESVVKYEVRAAALDRVPGLEHENIELGYQVRIKDEEFNPPLYLTARVIEESRSYTDPTWDEFLFGNFVEHELDPDAMLQNLHKILFNRSRRWDSSTRTIKSDTPPQDKTSLWIDTSQVPNVPKTWDEVRQEWVKASPTEAIEVGAETPEGAQEKADRAEENAKIYSENFTINYAQKQITSSPTPPENPEIGDLWFDNSTEPPTFRRWNGLEWEKLSATSFEELEGMIDKEQLPDRVIDATKLAIDAVQAENLAEGSVYAEAIQAEAVGAQAIAANAILAKHIAAGEVTANHLAADAVTANAIAAGAILSEHIASKSITTDKLMVGNLDNMIDNPNFIDSIEPHHVFMGRWGLFTGEQSFVQGKPSLECDAEELGGEQRIYLNGDHTIEVQPGERYYMTVWVRPSGPSGVTWNRLNLAFRCEDANGNYLAFAGSQTWVPGVDIPVRQWTQLSLIADIPAGAVRMAPTIRVLDDGANNISHYLFDAVNMRRMVDGNIVTGTLDAGQVTIGGTGPTRAHMGVDNIEFYRNNNYTGQVTTAQYDNNRDQILVHSPNQSALAASDEVGWGSLYKGAFVEAHNTSNNANVNLIAYNGSRVSEFSISATDGAALFGGLTVYGGQSVFYDPIVVEPLSGATALRLNIERAWEFRSYGTGSATELGLKALTAQKNFSIRNSDDQRIVDFRAHTSGGGMYVYRDFTVAGSKSAVVETENYGKRLMYALETPDSRFMDVIETTLEPGEHWIDLNPMFAETINGYSVFPIAQDGGKVQVLEREQNRFKLRVNSDEAVDVACWVYGKRVGHEDKYMEELKEAEGEEKSEH